MSEAAERKILLVPFYSQTGQGADRYRNDCLAACLRMVWGWYREQQDRRDPEMVTVDDFSWFLYDKPGSLGSILDVRKLPVRYQMPLKPVSRQQGITLERIRSEIEQERPVIALVMYGHLIRSQNPKDFFGHFVVVIGHDPEGFYVYDPLSSVVYVPDAAMELALTDGRQYFSNPYQGLVWNGS